MSFQKVVSEGKNLFPYWKQHADTESNSVAGTVALDILITLCSSSSVEKEFSAASKFLTIKRMRLQSELIDDLAVIIGNPQIAPKYIKLKEWFSIFTLYSFGRIAFLIQLNFDIPLYLFSENLNLTPFLLV
jgi:hypothetical protein